VQSNTVTVSRNTEIEKDAAILQLRGVYLKSDLKISQSDPLDDQ
jgi:hypothetical protein